MSEEIVIYEAGLAAFNGRKAKSTDDQVAQALSPIFIAHPHFEVTDEWLRLHKLMLRDIPPDVLARAVLEAIATESYVPSIAAIRKCAAVDERQPGPASEVDPARMKPIPMKMYRLDPEEDKKQRMERLRRTKGWNYA